MNPSLEAILHSGQTVALDVSRASAQLADKDLMFKARGMNRVIIFKYPSFETPDNPFMAAAARGFAPAPRRAIIGRRPIRTAIFLPHNAEEPESGGFALFIDEPQSAPLLVEHLGLGGEREEPYKHDWLILKTLMELPSLDPFLVENAFRQHGITVHKAYLQIDPKDADFIRETIADKVKPIIARAFGKSDPGRLETRARKFIDSIWDDTQAESSQFITAFGIKPEEAPAIFSAWKGVAFFGYEFDRNRTELKDMMSWLSCSLSLPLDRRQLPDAAKQQVKMLRDSIRDAARVILQNMFDIFGRYDQGYADLISRNDPKAFREFLLEAPKHYWALGAANSAMAQSLVTWRRYMQYSRDGQLPYEALDRLFQVCNKVLKGQAGDVGDLA